MATKESPRPISTAPKGPQTPIRVWGPGYDAWETVRWELDNNNPNTTDFRSGWMMSCGVEVVDATLWLPMEDLPESDCDHIAEGDNG